MYNYPKIIGHYSFCKMYRLICFLVILIASTYSLDDIDKEKQKNFIKVMRQRVLSPIGVELAKNKLKHALAYPAVPLVYITLGNLFPEYLLFSIEMAQSQNVVIVISDYFETLWTNLTHPKSNVFYIPLSYHFAELEDFNRVYFPVRIESGRKEYETKCIFRWFVLRNFTHTVPAKL